jgi:hypothetical protein
MSDLATERYKRTEDWLADQIPGFEVRLKKTSRFQRLIGKLAFFNNYMGFWTTMYPKIWAAELDAAALRKYNTLQHEGVHLLDAKTLFGLLKRTPAMLNAVLWYILYFFPQCLAVLAIFMVFNRWMALFLLFAAPWPAPFRMISEVRAFRRSLELGADEEKIVKRFTTSDYYFMWPFEKHVRKLLLKPSPYKEEMDKLL